MRNGIDLKTKRIKNNIKIVDMKVIHFEDNKLKQHVVLLYALGEDGLVYEFTKNKWLQLTEINEDTIHHIAED